MIAELEGVDVESIPPQQLTRTIADPVHCRAEGLRTGQRFPIGAQAVEFGIQAYDSSGAPTRAGGDAFFVAIRGAARCRARVLDHGDGTYVVGWRPTVSGTYHIAISIFGAAIQGSPFDVYVHDASPHAVRPGASARDTHTYARTA